MHRTPILVLPSPVLLRRCTAVRQHEVREPERRLAVDLGEVERVVPGFVWLVEVAPDHDIAVTADERGEAARVGWFHVDDDSARRFGRE